MSSPCRFVGSTTASFIARVTRPRGGARSTLILFQSRSGSGSTRGSMATDSPPAKAPRRHRLRRNWTSLFKVELGTNDDAHADVGSAVSKDVDSIASG